MKITRAADYGIRFMNYMGKRPNQLVKRAVVAEETGIPSHFLAKIAQDLAKSGLIEIRQGSSGGFVFDGGEVCFADVVEALSGPIAPCPASSDEDLSAIYAEINDEVSSTFRRYSVDYGGDE